MHFSLKGGGEEEIAYRNDHLGGLSEVRALVLAEIRNTRLIEKKENK